jgi:diguanylate cyclase (GGDEF)-like protein
VSICDCGASIASYERLAALYHDLLGQESLAALLQRAADAIAEIVPCSSVVIAETNLEERVIVPLVARGGWQEQTLRMRPRFGEGLIGWAVANGRPALANEAHLDPRSGHVAGTPIGHPEAIMCFPLISGAFVIGAFSLYREGEGHAFNAAEYAMAQRFAEAVTLALATAKSRQQLSELARSDHLTGCLNRRGLHEQLEILAQSSRDAGHSLALLLIDLDDFKGVNDRFGHATGDLLLRHVADQLRTQMPEAATLARLGGDEFAIVFIPGSDTEATQVMADVSDAINPLTFVSPSGAVSITASVGLGEVTTCTQAAEEHLLRRADESMYRRKHNLTRKTVGRRTRRDVQPNRAEE